MAETGMVEKVARALTETQVRTANELFKIADPRRVRTEEQIIAAIESGWRMNRADARAAIEAMRELPAGTMTHLQMNTEIGAYITENWIGAYSCMEKYHSAMIDAALNEEVAG
jgi:hypothetical protein